MNSSVPLHNSASSGSGIVMATLIAPTDPMKRTATTRASPVNFLALTANASPNSGYAMACLTVGMVLTKTQRTVVQQHVNLGASAVGTTLVFRY